MDESTRGQVTEILCRATVGDRAALDSVLPLVYDDLRALAARCVRSERPGNLFGPTALAHEAYLKLCERSQVPWKSRTHLLAAAAQAMRRILVDHARARLAQKRGGGQLFVPLNGEDAAAPQGASWTELVDLDRALASLAEAHARVARVVELLYFGGLTAAEACELLDVTERTVERDWRFGRAWLLRAMQGGSRVDGSH
jgi:RNA polymerase sigma factor (TIGR02999 family)